MQLYYALLAISLLGTSSVGTAASTSAPEAEKIADLRTTLAQTPLPSVLWDMIADYSHGPMITHTINLTKMLMPTEKVIGVYFIKEALPARPPNQSRYGISLLVVTHNQSTGKKLALTFSPSNATLLKTQDCTTTSPRSFLTQQKIKLPENPSLSASLEKDNLHATLLIPTEHNPDPTIAIYNRDPAYLGFKAAAASNALKESNSAPTTTAPQ